MGSWGSNLIWALIFTKFGGKERFCKLLNNLSLDLQFFYFESPVWPPEGVKWGSNLIWALIFTKFGGEECFCKLLKALTLDLQFFDFESPIWPPFDPQKGSNGGQIRVKLYLSSDLHHIWWEGAFLLVIKGSFIRFAIFWLWVPIWPSEGVKWGSKVKVALRFTKLGGKESFCKFLKGISWYSWFFYFESPIWPHEGLRGVEWGSKLIWAPISTKFGGKEPFCN
jgi:hypothetical protein